MSALHEMVVSSKFSVSIQGAQPSETVKKILTLSGIWEQFEKTQPKKTLAKAATRAKVMQASQKISIDAHIAKKAKDAPEPEAPQADTTVNEDEKTESE